MKYLSLLLINLAIFGFAFSAAAKKPDKYFEAVHNHLNFREAASYANHVSNRNIEVGLERISKDGMKRLLGNSTSKYLPFDIAVTNNSQFRIYINQIVIKNVGGQAYPHVDLSSVIEAIDPGGKGNKDDMRDAVLRTNILEKSLPHIVINPGETVQGIVFVKSKSLSEGDELYLQIQNLKRVAFLDFKLSLN
ncbi:MAG: hypothetical protein COB92_00750 [Robiginitomaculum sp.]|nr:MAG: hypothetical protein COB92_00750 [Robiginitomaculum sp.]